jgi:hypothetical protein
MVHFLASANHWIDFKWMFYLSQADKAICVMLFLYFVEHAKILLFQKLNPKSGLLKYSDKKTKCPALFYCVSLLISFKVVPSLGIFKNLPGLKHDLKDKIDLVELCTCVLKLGQNGIYDLRYPLLLL